MWTTENRPRYNRDGLRYPSDLTDAEWSHIAGLIPPGKRGGGKRRVDLREVMNGIMYILSTGCQWRAIPKDLPPRSTLFDYLDLWSWDGTLERIHHHVATHSMSSAERTANALSTGCQWRAIPKDLPPRSTLFDYLDLWSWDGTLERIHHALYVECREDGEREASPTAAIIDSQSVKSAEKGGRRSIRMVTMQERRSRARSATFS